MHMAMTAIPDFVELGIERSIRGETRLCQIDFAPGNRPARSLRRFRLDRFVAYWYVAYCPVPAFRLVRRLIQTGSSISFAALLGPNGQIYLRREEDRAALLVAVKKFVKPPSRVLFSIHFRFIRLHLTPRLPVFFPFSL